MTIAVRQRLDDALASGGRSISTVLTRGRETRPMRQTPIPILARGYGLAFVAAGALWASGASIAAAALAAWVGGAALTLCLAMLGDRRCAVEANLATAADEAAALEAALAAWRADQLGDRSAPAERARTGLG